MEIHITDDFDLDRIADSGQCFRWRKDDSGAYRIIHKGHCLKIRSLGNAMFRLSCSEDEYREIWHDYFDFGENYRSVRERVSREEDPFLADACEYGKELAAAVAFENVMGCQFHPEKSGRVGLSILKAFCEVPV